MLYVHHSYASLFVNKMSVNAILNGAPNGGCFRLSRSLKKTFPEVSEMFMEGVNSLAGNNSGRGVSTQDFRDI